MLAALLLLRGPQPFVPDVIGDPRYAVVQADQGIVCDRRRLDLDATYLDLTVLVTPEGVRVAQPGPDVFVEHGADPTPLHQAVAAFTASAPPGAVLANLLVKATEDTDLQHLIHGLELGPAGFERVIVSTAHGFSSTGFDLSREQWLQRAHPGAPKPEAR